MEETFRTKITDGDIYGLNKAFGIRDVDIDCGKPSIYIDWSFEIEARGWGIKGFSAYATKVVASIEWDVDTEDASEEEKGILINDLKGMLYETEFSKSISGTIELNSNEDFNGRKWEIESDIDVTTDGCRPESIEVDFEAMKIIVS